MKRKYDEIKKSLLESNIITFKIPYLHSKKVKSKFITSVNYFDNPYALVLADGIKVQDIAELFFYFYRKLNPYRGTVIINEFVNSVFSEVYLQKKERKKSIKKREDKFFGTNTIIEREEFIDLLNVISFLKEKSIFKKEVSNREISKAILSFFLIPPISDRMIREYLSNPKLDEVSRYHLNFHFNKKKLLKSNK